MEVSAADAAATTSTHETACTPEHAAKGHCALAVDGPPSVPSIGLAVGVVTARYRTPLFEGSYQGATIGASISAGRFAFAAAITEYQLVRNGLATYGPGDVMMHVHTQLVARRQFSGGAMVMGSLPSGDGERGFGMGHVMLMPELWAEWDTPTFTLAATVGGSYAFGGAEAHAKHGGSGTWPLVDPMNAREVTFDAGAMYMLAPTLSAGARVFGAAPINDGLTRVAIAGRVAWTLGRTVTSLEIAGGAVGDPFGLRGTLGTTIRLR